jgi:group I intron endonuclease
MVKKGENHPLFGKVVSQATREKSRMSQGTSVIVLDKEINETKTYFSIRQAAKELSTTDTTVRKYIESGKLYKGRYAITKEFSK